MQGIVLPFAVIPYSPRSAAHYFLHVQIGWSVEELSNKTKDWEQIELFNFSGSSLKYLLQINICHIHENNTGICRSRAYCDGNSQVKARFIGTDVTANGSYYVSDLWIIE